MKATHKGAPAGMFADMRRARRLDGDVAGYNAAIHVWTCIGCGYDREDSPYKRPGTRAKPDPCAVCHRASYAHSASKGEASRYAELRADKSIQGLKHPATTLDIEVYSVVADRTVKVKEYTADFEYERCDDHAPVFEDFKGRKDIPELKVFVHDLVWHQYGIDVLISYYPGRRGSRISFVPSRRM